MLDALPKNSGTDRRVHPRIPCDIRDVHGQTFRNLSLGGALIESHYNYCVNQQLLLQFSLPTGKGNLKLHARVVRSQPAEDHRRGKYGVAFDQNGSSEQQILSQFLLRQISEASPSLQLIGKGIKYRPSRYGFDFLKGLQTQCLIKLGTREEEVNLKNFSKHGACLISNTPLVLNDRETTTEIFVLLEEKEVFRGLASLRHHRNCGQGYEYGFQFCNKVIDLDLVFSIRELAQVSRSVTHIREEVDQSLHRIMPEFKVIVSNLRFVLDKLKELMESEQKVLDRIANSSQKKMVEEECLELVDTQLRRKVHDLIGGMEEIFRNLLPQDQEFYIKYCRDTLLEHLHHAPFIKRAYLKPLGYPGDFETMRMMYEEKHSGQSLWQKAVNNLFWTLGTPQAVRNRVHYLKEKIKSVLACNPAMPKQIMSLACGPAEEIRFLFTDPSDPLSLSEEVTFHLIDYDTHALGYLHNVLRDLNLRRRKEVTLDTYGINVRDFIKNPEMREKFPPQDLIYTAGLFDYLSDEIAELLIGIFYFMLKPGGQMIVGNFSPFNPFRLTQEFGLDWFLTYRNPRDLKNLVPKFLECSTIEVEDESTHINLFLNVTRAGNGEAKR